MYICVYIYINLLLSKTLPHKALIKLIKWETYIFVFDYTDKC